MNPLAVNLATIDVPTFNLTSILIRILTLLPLLGGYLLAREGKGNLALEVAAVILLVLATVVPTTEATSADSLPTILNALLDRWPVALFLLGLAFVRDGGIKMILGLLLMGVSGVVLLPRV